VPAGLKGEFTAEMTYQAKPFAVTVQPTKFTLK
jgi:hypothetical protein